MPTYESLFESSDDFGQCLTVQQDRCKYDGHWATVGEYTRREGQTERAYRFHRFLLYPQGGDAQPWAFHSLRENVDRIFTKGPTQSVFLSPFRWHASQGWNEGSYHAASTVVNAPALDQPRFVIVVDEFGTRAAMMDREVDYTPGADGARKAGMTARTVYEINAWGYVLKSRRWDYKGDAASVTMKGVGQEFKYKAVGDVICTGSQWRSTPCDCGVELQTRVEPPATPPSVCPPKAFLNELVLVEKRSIGWSVAESAQQGGGDTQGLVEFYQYGFNANPAVKQEDYPWSSRLHIVATGVKKGTQGTPYYQGQRFYAEERPGQLVCDVRFNTPVTQLLASAPAAPTGADPDPAYAATFYQQTYHASGAYPQCTEQLASTLQIQPPLRQRPGGPLYYPIERVLYTTEGQAHWQITGLVKSPLAPADDPLDSLQRLLFTYTKHGMYGNVDYIVADAVPGVDVADPSTPGYVLTVPQLPAEAQGLVRISPTAALMHPTLNWYDFKGNLTDSFQPGKRWAVRFVVNDPDPQVDGDEEVEEYTFENLVRSGAGDNDYGPFKSQSQGMRQLLKGRDRSGAEIKKEMVYYPSDNLSLIMSGSVAGSAQTGVPAYETIKQIVYKLDSFGRPRGADVLERTTGPTGQALLLPVGEREVNDLGEVYRQWDYGGNVTRWTRNHLGQRLRKYVGSIDSQWGNPGRDPDNVQGGTNEFGSRYDMVLKERTQFGSTPNDVWQPTVERRYVRDPQWAHSDYYGTPPGADADAYVSKHSYDWRGRRVRTDEYDVGDPWASSAPAPRLRTTLHYLDYAGREVMAVEFGPLMPTALPAELDPTLLVPSSAMPEAEAFLALSPRPVSITKKLYDAGDRVVEERSYDVSAPASSSPYTVRRTLYGQGGQQVFSQSEDGRCEVVMLDGIGRVSRKATVAYGRSANVLGYELSRTDYDMDVEGRVTEEVTWERVRESGAALDVTNAVPSRRWMWYDTEGRKTAEANLGTGLLGASGWTEFRAPTSGESVLARPGTGPLLTRPGGMTFVFDGRSSLPAWAQVTGSMYDRAGHLVASIAADGVVTTFAYQGDKVKEQVENASGFVAAQRKTKNTYASGRLVSKDVAGLLGERAAGFDNEKSGAACRYGAAVLDQEFELRSYDRTLVGAMGRIGSGASPLTGEWEFVYSYNFLGQLAQRLAADGTVTRYRYDGLGRLASIEVGHTLTGTDFTAGYAPSPQSEVAADRIGYVEFFSTWAAVAGVPIETRDIVARIGKVDPANPAQPGRVISHVRQKFDGRGKLVQEWQSHGAPVAASTPSVQYQWSFQAAAGDHTGRTRLTAMLYPAIDVSERRTVTLGYGAAGSLDDDLSRVASISTSVPGFGTASLSSYGYTGADRRAVCTLGASGVTQSLDGNAAAVGLTRLDGFGRIRDLTFRNGNNGVLYGCGYDYDLADRITAAKVTHVPVGAQPQTNTRSSVYGYDAFGRLTGQELGAADGVWGGAAGQWSVASAGKLRSDSWHLDVLDNWSVSATGSALPNAGGRVSTGNLDWHGTAFAYPGASASADSLVSRAATTDRSDLAQVRKSVDGGAPVSAVVLRDALGRIVCDSLFYYHYDAWGRLVQVNVAKYSEGLGGTPEWVSSDVIRHLVYDGLGRLIRVQAPVTAPVLDPQVQQVELLGPMRSELLYYDGVRRITEVVVDPVDPKAVALISEDLAEQQAAQQTQGESGGPGGGQKTANVSYEKAVSAPTRIGREYVWGPGDSWAGIDELVAQFDGESRQTPWWALQDLAGDVVALVYKPSNSAAAVAWQCTYEPYGGVLAEVSHVEHPRVHVGHKGLFADNLDTQSFTALEPELQPRLAARRPLLYHVRNRSLLAGEPVDEEGNARVWAGGLGRFLQPDPNATGVAVAHLPNYFGTAESSESPSPNLAVHAGDGVAALAYCGASPIVNADRYGLFLMPVGPSTTMDMWTDHAQATLEAGNDVRGYLMNMFGNYGMESMLDHQWASDWSEPDDLYSRSANAQMGTGSWADYGHGEGLTEYGGEVMAGGPRWKDPLMASFTSGLKRGQVGVYLVMDGDEVLYVGRSIDLARRVGEQAKRFAGKQIVSLSVGSLGATRALEDMLIRHFKSIGQAGENAINGMTTKNAKRAERYADMRKFMTRFL
ncbi:MAG TPA: hypothetical protein VEB22_05570 [Phycisphaerales bacterium]|nr:hypothetical protein [Phycisphaerales bacterium]